MKIRILSLLLMIGLNSFGTAQIPDLLIYKGDTLSLFATPLVQLPHRELLTPKSLFGGKGCFFTACWRNYIATWSVENDKLYLLSIRNACYPTELKNVAASYKAKADSIGTEYADLGKLFPGKYINGKVLADWVTDTMIAPKGKMLYYIHMGFESIYEKETEFMFKAGVLLKTNELDNSGTKKSKYSENTDLLLKYIQSKIDYSRLPKSDQPIKVFVSISNVNDNGKIDSVKVLRGVSEIFDREAVRVIKSIPQWDVLYRHGKRIPNNWSIQVTFYPDKPKPLEYQLPPKAGAKKKLN